MIHYTTAQTDADLQGILALQQSNLTVNLNEGEIVSQGFVTVVHSVAALQKLADTEPQVIIKDGDRVVGYLLAMTSNAKDDIPLLRPMFALFDSLLFGGKPVSGYRYVVVGQVCIDKLYRGQGLLDDSYQFYRNLFSPRFDFAITEISTRNSRSLAAHKRIGFKELLRYGAPDGETWSVVVWNWPAE